MKNNFERRQSLGLVFLIVILFILTISQRFLNMWVISLAWYVVFILSWLLMLIFSINVLFNKDARAFSIFTAILTSLAFGLLGLHGLSALAIFLKALPTNIYIGSKFFVDYSQLIFYSSLIVVYFFHMVNLIVLRPRDIKLMKEVGENKEDIDKLRKIRDQKLDQIIADIDKEENELSAKDKEVLNSHILKDEDAGEEDRSEIEIYE